MFKRIIISVSLSLCIFAGQEISASPANPTPLKMKQPDGTEVTIKLKGDENVKWMESMDGYSLMYSKDKYIVYAVLNEKGDMVPSEVVFQESTLRSTDLSAFKGSLKKRLRYSSSQIKIFREIEQIEQSALSASLQPKLRATTGQAKAICALIGFPDKPFAHTVAEFDQLMNQVGYSTNGAKGSVKDFYSENSYGKMELVVTVVGPYTASKGWSYYGGNIDKNNRDKNVRELAQEAANFAFKDPSVNPVIYDNDNDGMIDTFHFLYAGYGEEAGGGEDCIWAHKSGYSPVLTFGSKKLSVYSCSPELKGNSGNNITNIGVICHELCHVFGAPDYYDTNDDGIAYDGTGKWDLMAGGSWNGPDGNLGVSPAHINMYQKIVFGWVTPTELAAQTNISGMLNSAENPVAYKINSTTPDEYFILENRQKLKFDEYVPGSGLLIYHVSSSASGNNVTNAGHPQQVYPICASSQFATPTSDPSSYGSINSSGCPFPGSSGNTAFTDYSTPSAKSWNGNNTSKPITEIKEQNKLISFSFMKTGATVSNVRTSVQGQNVTVSWDLPQGAVPNKYAIYRNNQTLITLNDGSAKSYTQYGVSAGTYTYCVAPVYGVSESAKQCAPATTVSGATIDCPPVKNLQITSVADMVKLSWSPDFDGGWITHSGEVAYKRGANTKKFSVASRWTQEDLNSMKGAKLTKVRFIPTESACEYTIKVWSSAPNTLTPTLITEQKVSSFSVQYLTEVDLTNPVVIEDSNKEYWIGLEYNITATNISEIFPAASDAGPGVALRNLLYKTKWEYVNENFNWSIAGYLESPVLRSTGTWVLPSGNESQNMSKDMSQDISQNMSEPEDAFTYLEKISTIELLPSQDRLKASIPAISGYKIYRDGNLLKTVKTAYFSDSVVPLGNHTYCISSIYGTCESEQVCGVATSITPPDKFPPVKNLAGSVERSTVTLTWEKPEERGRSLGYSSTTPDGFIGSDTAPLDFDIAIRYAAGDLVAQNGSKLTKVQFVPGNVGSTYSIRVWKGGSAFSPGGLYVDQSVKAVKAGAWQEVVLTFPIELNIYEDLWIGVHCVSSAGQHPAVTDNTPGVPGKGDLIYIDGKWMQGSEVIKDFNNNWCIKGTLEPLAPFFSYGIYRNGEFLGFTNALIFGQSFVEQGSYKYDVSAMYAWWNESRKESININVIYTGINKVLSDNLVNIFPNPVARGGILTIDLGADNNSAEVLFYSISGQMVKKESLRGRTSTCRIDLPSGTYVMQVRLANGKINTLKIIVK